MKDRVVKTGEQITFLLQEVFKRRVDSSQKHLLCRGYDKHWLGYTKYSRRSAQLDDPADSPAVMAAGTDFSPCRTAHVHELSLAGLLPGSAFPLMASALAFSGDLGACVI